MPPGVGKSLPRRTGWRGACCMSVVVSRVEVVRCQVPVGLGVSPLRGAGAPARGIHGARPLGQVKTQGSEYQTSITAPESSAMRVRLPTNQCVVASSERPSRGSWAHM